MLNGSVVCPVRWPPCVCVPRLIGWHLTESGEAERIKESHSNWFTQIMNRICASYSSLAMLLQRSRLVMLFYLWPYMSSLLFVYFRCVGLSLYLVAFVSAVVDVRLAPNKNRTQFSSVCYFVSQHILLPFGRVFVELIDGLGCTRARAGERATVRMSQSDSVLWRMCCCSTLYSGSYVYVCLVAGWCCFFSRRSAHKKGVQSRSTRTVCSRTQHKCKTSGTEAISRPYQHDTYAIFRGEPMAKYGLTALLIRGYFTHRHQTNKPNGASEKNKTDIYVFEHCANVPCTGKMKTDN